MAVGSGVGIGARVGVSVGVSVGVGTRVGVGVAIGNTGLIVGVGPGCAQAVTKTEPNSSKTRPIRENALVVFVTDFTLRIAKPPMRQPSIPYR